MERTTLIVKLSLKLQCSGQSYLIIVMHIFVSGNITITVVGADDVVRQVDERNKGVILKNCAPFTDCVSEINNIHIDNVKHIDVVMPISNLIVYSNNYSKTSENL